MNEPISLAKEKYLEFKYKMRFLKNTDTNETEMFYNVFLC